MPSNKKCTNVSRLCAFLFCCVLFNYFLTEFPNDDIIITMPDGSEKKGKAFVTKPYDVAKGISSQFADKCIVAKVKYEKRVATLDEGLLNPEAEDDKDEQDQWFYWDMMRVLEGSCKLFLYKFDNEEGRETFWHSSAHVLGQVLEEEYGVKLTIGPPTENGFFYDSYTGKNIFKEEDYGSIEKAAKKVCDSKQQFDRLVLTKEEALELFGDNPFKVSFISDKIPAGGKVTAYKCGRLIDLCTGPHIPSTKIIKAFKVTKNSASSWLGKVENDSLQRVYGITFPSKKEMDEYVHRMEEAAKRDHRTIAKA
jgi:threonyl-tRNA synthetase